MSKTTEDRLKEIEAMQFGPAVPDSLPANIEKKATHTKDQFAKEVCGKDGCKIPEIKQLPHIEQVPKQTIGTLIKVPEPENNVAEHKVASTHELLSAIDALLIEKNSRYGDSTYKRLNIFDNVRWTTAEEQKIAIRLDEKLARVMHTDSETARTNDIVDIIGYCTLLLRLMGVTKKDILDLID